MRQHLILYHTYEQLAIWGLNRNYLKYLQGEVTRE